MISGKKIQCQYWQSGVLLFLVLVLAGCSEQRPEAREAPDFNLLSLTSDQQISLQNYRGDVVYLTFWASWCIPCRKEMPYLTQLWQRHRAQGFRVIGISVDEDVAAARQFAEEYDLPYPLARDADRSISSLYRVPGYPTHYLVDRRGRIRFSGLGFDDSDITAVGQEVETLLQESVDGAD
ncbi:MAG: TlpA family protein disulfide reductase [Halieaceae bacterium]|jgi:peroxiredoxin|nr:TlpA family protein disulfide reductase [Halieaceae bacterium]